jgi:hypothetical protein
MNSFDQAIKLAVRSKTRRSVVRAFLVATVAASPLRTFARSYEDIAKRCGIKDPGSGAVNCDDDSDCPGMQKCLNWGGTVDDNTAVHFCIDPIKLGKKTCSPENCVDPTRACLIGVQLYRCGSCEKRSKRKSA